MPQLWSRSIAIAALICTTTACSDAPTGNSDAEQLAVSEGNFTTDRSVYTATTEQTGGYARFTFQLVARFTNTTSETVYLSRCYPNSASPTFGVELLEQGTDTWGSAYNMAWACVGHDEQFAVAPGATRTDTFEIGGPNAFDGYTKRPFGVLTGRMRLVYSVQGCRGDGACRLTTSIGESTPFEVRVEQ